MWHPNEKETNLLRHAIEYHNAEAQIIKAAEEYAEAAAEISRAALATNFNKAYETDRLAEELADAQIMLAQILLMYPSLEEEIKQWRGYKLARLAGLTGFEEYFNTQK